MFDDGEELIGCTGFSSGASSTPRQTYDTYTLLVLRVPIRDNRAYNSPPIFFTRSVFFSRIIHSACPCHLRSINNLSSTMQIKRKRSTDSPSTSSSTSTPPQSSSSTSASRTLKRYRDNRPSEEIIHATTMQKMYAAQRQGHAPEPLLSTPIMDIDTQSDSGYGQKRLDSFWAVPKTQTCSAKQTWTNQQSWHGPRCEDCDAPIVDTEDIAGGMGGADYQMSGTDAAEVQSGGCCAGCGRRVCGLCSLVREQRVCLECAGKGFM